MSKKESLAIRLRRALVSLDEVGQERVALERLEGGFTGASKYIVTSGSGKLFIKTADNKTHGVDSFLIEQEGEIYSIFESIGLTESVFPRYIKSIKSNGLSALVVEYLDEATWGGPWNLTTVEQLDRALSKMHNVPLSEKDEKKLRSVAKSVRQKLGMKVGEKEKKESTLEKYKEFLDAWDTDSSGFVDSSGNVYFSGHEDLPNRVIESVETKDTVKDSIIMQDMNFGNIGFTKEQAYFVDPVYATIGDPLHDRTVAGVNILQQLRDSIDPGLKRIVDERFITSRYHLAKMVIYYVVSTAKKLGSSQSAWQQFHKECSLVSLRMFVDF